MIADLRAEVERATLALRGAREARKEIVAHAKRACAECKRSRVAAKGSLPAVRRSRESRNALEREKQDAIARVYGRRRRGASSKEKQSEEVERVERDIEATSPELLPLWLSMRTKFVAQWRKEKGKRSLWEAFQEYVHENREDASAYLASYGEKQADALIAERERELESARAEVSSLEHETWQGAEIEDDDFSSWLKKNPTSAFVAMGNAIEVELVNGRVVRFPPKTILAYAPRRTARALVLVYGLEKTRTQAPDDAREEYEKTHWGKSGAWGMGTGDRPAPAGKGLAIARVVYATKKGGDSELTYYEHDFEAPLPRLAGRQIAGGGYRVTERGIVG